ncbi:MULTISPECIES: 2Fe-2S iron-sulfur cluster-binding protein [unclassified Roseovarius]|uniref:2Fe-2S iron-sulfur cluster-binding protein n=1 Tax=unclassified Roseovarius TaxID=2614913 RepID=UPI00273D3A27|nr:2Fe-2S iron-sulfur cluster-binding protein [Roseovarius sp. MMSF_3350]
MQTTLTVNGTRHQLDLDPRVTLLDALRDHLCLTGSKKGCDHGQCGACTVIADGRRINACLTLAVMHDGAELVTVEGLADGESLSPLQQAFLDHDGMQCGYCTPGQLCSATAMLEEVRAGRASHVTGELEGEMRLTREEITERMSGNLCRCACYSGIVAAIEEAATK